MRPGTSRDGGSADSARANRDKWAPAAQNAGFRDGVVAIVFIIMCLRCIAKVDGSAAKPRLATRLVAREQQDRPAGESLPGLRFRPAGGVWHNDPNFSTSLRRLRWRGETAFLPILSVRGETS
jgi:hypothetical protein